MKTLTIKNDNLYITSIYNHPNNLITTKQIENITADTDKHIIIGDFNARNYNWGCPTDNIYETQLLTAINELGLEIFYPNESTNIPTNCRPGTIDFVISKIIYINKIEYPPIITQY